MRFFTKRYEEWGYTGGYEIVKHSFIRVNPLKAKKLPDRFLAKKVEPLDNGYEVGSIFSLVSSPEYSQGEFYIQDASTQCAALALDPK